MEPFEVMISRVAGADVRRGPTRTRWEDVREVCERWGLPGRGHRAGHRRRRHRDRRGRSRGRRSPSGRAELARIPARALTSDAIVHERLAARADAPARRRRPPARRSEAATACRSGGWTRAPSCSRCSARRTSRRAHPVFEQYDSTVGADTVAGPGRGAAVLRVKGTTKALVATTDGNQARRRAGPVAGRRAERRRGDPQRLDHRRPAARRDELPQLRRPDAARGVLAAHRGRARPRRRVPGARPAGHRRQRLALQRVARRAPSPRPRRSASSGCSTTSRRSSARRSQRPRDAILLVGEADARAGRLGLRGARRRRRRGRPARRSTSPARRPSRRSSARRSRAASSPPPRTCRAAGWPSPSPSARCGAGSGPSVRIAVANSPAVDLFGESPSRLVVTLPAAVRRRRSSCSPASTACRSRRSARSAATGS